MSIFSDFSPGGGNVTQSDTASVPGAPVGITVHAEGTIKVKCVNGNDVTYPIPSGASLPFILPYRVKQVYNTGTDIADANITYFLLPNSGE